MFNSQQINKHSAIESFKQSLWKARKDVLLSKVFGESPSLKLLEEVSANWSQQRHSLGIKEIPVEKITGTVGRQDDFDCYFRPLKKHLRDRWVSIAVHFRDAGWPPIEVFKVGDDYFVLDGHHRTSYARNMGMMFLEAEVWEVVQEPAKNMMPDVPAPTKFVPQPAPVSGIVVHESYCCCC